MVTPRHTLSEIAREAGLRSPAIYYYFGSRDELVPAVMRGGQELARRHVLKVLDDVPESSSAREQMLAAIEAHLHVELELSEFATAVTRNAAHVPDGIRRELDIESEYFHAIWRELLLYGRSEGSLRRDLDLTITRMLVIGALNWAAEWHSGRISVDAVVATAQQMIDHALFVAPQGPSEELGVAASRSSPSVAPQRSTVPAPTGPEDAT